MLTTQEDSLSSLSLSLLVAALGLSLFLEIAAELVEAVVEDPVLFPCPLELASLFLAVLVQVAGLFVEVVFLFLEVVAVVCCFVNRFNA